MLTTKSSISILLILLTLCSCGTITRTRYGNGYRLNTGISFPKRKDTPTPGGRLNCRAHTPAPGIASSKPVIAHPIDKNFQIPKNGLTGDKALQTQKDLAINEFSDATDKRFYTGKLISPSKKNQFISPQPELSTTAITKDYKNKNGEGILLISVKVLLSILVFGSIVALFIIAALSMLIVGVFTGGQYDFGDSSPFKGIIKLSNFTYKSIWSSWKRAEGGLSREERRELKKKKRYELEKDQDEEI